MALSPVDELQKSLAKLFLTPEYSDLTVRCGSAVFPVHKAIVCPRSEFFAAAKRSGDKNTAVDEIHLEHDDPALIKHLFNYLYTLDYPADPNEDSSSTVDETYSSDTEESGAHDADAKHHDVAILEGLAVDADGKIRNQHGHVVGELVEGDAYRISRFKYTCNAEGQIINVTGRLLGRAQPLKHSSASSSSKHSHASASASSSSLAWHASVHALADKFGIPSLKALAREKFTAECEAIWDTPAFLEAAEEVYASSSPHNELRKTIVHTLISHIELLEQPHVQEVMHRINGLAFEILKTGFLRWDVLYYRKYVASESTYVRHL